MYRKYEDGHTDFVQKQLTQKGLDKAVSVCYNTKALKGVPEYRGVEQLEARRAHNPEVVGSSPASATIKTTVFNSKTVVFLTFRRKMESVKMGLELVLELIAQRAKKPKRRKSNFFAFLNFLKMM